MNVLVTGGLGYIGSHTIVELLLKGYNVICIDDLSNSNIEFYKRIKIITNRDFDFYEVDLNNKQSLKNCLSNYQKIDAMIHFAANVYVKESTLDPLKYYSNNLVSLINILEVTKKFSCDILFSSSCTVYGNAQKYPVKENMETKRPISPYGNTKKIGEEILKDYFSQSFQNISCLRYFNPAGAHESNLIGELSKSKPEHLIPYITKVANGELEKLIIYGNDYPTYDGTCIRDYIHVSDVASAHVKCIEFMSKINNRFEIFNIGTGKGTSVLDVIKTFNRLLNMNIKYEFGPRREGDASKVWACCEKAKKILKWNSIFEIDDILKSSWQWEKESKNFLE